LQSPRRAQAMLCSRMQRPNPRQTKTVVTVANVFWLGRHTLQKSPRHAVHQVKAALEIFPLALDGRAAVSDAAVRSSNSPVSGGAEHVSSAWRRGQNRDCPAAAKEMQCLGLHAQERNEMQCLGLHAQERNRKNTVQQRGTHQDQGDGQEEKIVVCPNRTSQRCCTIREEC